MSDTQKIDVLAVLRRDASDARSYRALMVNAARDAIYDTAKEEFRSQCAESAIAIAALAELIETVDLFCAIPGAELQSAQRYVAIQRMRAALARMGR